MHDAGLLHTIIFNRALGPVRPREVDSELFDITYVRRSPEHKVTGLLAILAFAKCTVILKAWLGAGKYTSLLRAVQVQCGDSQVDEKIESKINQFYSWVEKHPGKHGQVSPVVHMQPGWSTVQVPLSLA